MAVGLPLKTTYANGDVYSASDVNDTNGTVNLFTSSTLSSQADKVPLKVPKTSKLKLVTVMTELESQRATVE